MYVLENRSELGIGEHIQDTTTDATQSGIYHRGHGTLNYVNPARPIARTMPNK
jgi:hypothetical protein